MRTPKGSRIRIEIKRIHAFLHCVRCPRVHGDDGRGPIEVQAPFEGGPAGEAARGARRIQPPA